MVGPPCRVTKSLPGKIKPGLLYAIRVVWIGRLLTVMLMVGVAQLPLLPFS